MVLFSKIRNSPISFVELLELPTNMYKYVITVIGETSAPTQFKQGKNFNIIQALFFVITGDVVLKSRSSRSNFNLKL